MSRCQPSHLGEIRNCQPRPRGGLAAGAPDAAGESPEPVRSPGSSALLDAGGSLDMEMSVDLARRCQPWRRRRSRWHFRPLYPGCPGHPGAGLGVGGERFAQLLSMQRPPLTPAAFDDQVRRSLYGIMLTRGRRVDMARFVNARLLRQDWPLLRSSLDPKVRRCCERRLALRHHADPG